MKTMKILRFSCAAIFLLPATLLLFSITPSSTASASSSSLPDKPNLLVILTDQERDHVHWPPGLLEELMPSWGRLKAHGLEFQRAYSSVSMCSPSRAALISGEYGNSNGNVETEPFRSLKNVTELANIASILGAAGYDVVWKGKWHLSLPVATEGLRVRPQDENWQEEDIPVLESRYGMQDWNPPDCGNTAGAYLPTNNATERAKGLTVLGGGNANNDLRILRGNQATGTQGFGFSAIEYLTDYANTPDDQRKPFALFVSFVNPHDIAMFPDGWDEAGYDVSQFEHLPVDLPVNKRDDLSTKPSVQAAFKAAINAKTPFDDKNSTEENYVKFYAYLHSVVEPHITGLLDAMDNLGLSNGTMILRTADHGELGMSHGLREKAYTAYEEMIHIPLVVSNPKLFAEPATTDSLWSHVDMFPTLASLASSNAISEAGVGKSQSSVLLDPSTSVQDSVLFTFDDTFLLENAKNGHIRALRDERWTYAVYYEADGSSFEFELYDNTVDPGQLDNLLFKIPTTTETTLVWQSLHDRLINKMSETMATPEGFDFPPDPVPVHPESSQPATGQTSQGYRSRSFLNLPSLLAMMMLVYYTT